MRKLLLLALAWLGFTAGVAGADWQLVEESPAVRHYFDPQTLEKIDGLPSIAVLHDFNQRTHRGELSARYRAEFDCPARRWRVFDFATFAEAMASGDIVTRTDEDPEGRSDWRGLPDNPGFMQFFRFACGE